MPANISSIFSQSFGNITLSSVLSALLSLIICLIVIRIVLRLVKRLLTKTKLETRVQGYVCTAIKCVLYLLTAIIVVSSLGIDTSSLVALLSVVSLGATLAAEDILGNMAGGLVLLSSHTFRIGNIVEISNVVGTVAEISLNHTKLETADGKMVLLPNKSVSGSQITNYSALGRRRIELAITASYDAPTETVKSACQDALKATPFLLEDPASSVVLTNYGESSIEYTIYCWTDPINYIAARAALNENLRPAFEAHQIEMTYDHLNVHIVENRG